MSAVGCFGRFTFSHLAFHIPTLAGSCLCLFCVVVCLVVLFLCFWFLFCKCLGIPNSPRSLDLDDRQGLIARSAMQQKKKSGGASPVFCQQAGGAWLPCKDLKLSITVLMSQSSKPHHWFSADSAVGNQVRHSCCIVVAPTLMSRMKLPFTRAISGHRSMTTLIGWHWICLLEGLHYAFCSF